jgi:hypothetical protein
VFDEWTGREAITRRERVAAFAVPRLTALAAAIAVALIGPAYAASAPPSASAPPTAADRALLAAADLQSGAPASFRAVVRIEPLQPGRPGADLELWRSGDRTLLRFLDARNAGKGFLNAPGEAWFLSKTARPVRLAPTHRLAGGLSLQELLGVAYARDFRIESVARTGSGDSTLATFELQATAPGLPYPQVRYVVREKTRQPVRMELRLPSGKAARMLEIAAWMPGRRLAPAEIVVKDLVGSQPPVRVRFLALDERAVPAGLLALGAEGDKARAANPPRGAG